MFGYRPREVDAAVATRDSALGRCGAKLGEAVEAIEERDGRIVAQRTELAAVNARVEELERVAERLAERVVRRERELRALRTSAAAAPAEAPPRPAAPASTDGPSPSPNGHQPEAPAAEIFEGLVEVELGPLSDFAQLVGFEDAAGAIGAAGEISVKRFAKGRATLELHLGEPVELLRELEERAPFEFRVRDTRQGRVILDIEGE